MNSSILSKILFTIHSEDDFLYDPHNKEYLVYREDQQYAPDVLAKSHDTSLYYVKDDTPAPQPPTESYLRITTDDWPRNPHFGFLFGSDPDTCDILLDKNRARSVSGSQFALKIHTTEKGTFEFRNYSQHGTKIVLQNENALVKTRRAIPYNKEVRVSIGPVKFQIRVPSHAAHWDSFEANWERFAAQYSDLLPNVRQLDLESVLRTSCTSSKPDNYRKQCKLGGGQSGEVWLATCRITNKVFAVRYYHTLSGAEHEAKILETILKETPQARIVDFVELLPYKKAIVTKYVGMNLEVLAKERHLRPNELRQVIRGIHDAISHLYDCGIVHSDLKPVNVLLKPTSPFDVQVCDFGTALVSGRTSYGRMHVSGKYVAPEVTLQQDEVTTAADLWSLGVIALELAHGLPPYHNKSIDGWPKLITHYVDRLQRTFLVQILEGWLNIHPEARFNTKITAQFHYFTLSDEVLFEGNGVRNLSDVQWETQSIGSLLDTASFGGSPAPQGFSSSQEEGEENNEESESEESISPSAKSLGIEDESSTSSFTEEGNLDATSLGGSMNQSIQLLEDEDQHNFSESTIPSVPSLEISNSTGESIPNTASHEESTTTNMPILRFRGDTEEMVMANLSGSGIIPTAHYWGEHSQIEPQGDPDWESVRSTASLPGGLASWTVEEGRCDFEADVTKTNPGRQSSPLEEDPMYPGENDQQECDPSVWYQCNGFDTTVGHSTAIQPLQFMNAIKLEELSSGKLLHRLPEAATGVSSLHSFQQYTKRQGCKASSASNYSQSSKRTAMWEDTAQGLDAGNKGFQRSHGEEHLSGAASWGMNWNSHTSSRLLDEENGNSAGIQEMTSQLSKSQYDQDGTVANLSIANLLQHGSSSAFAGLESPLLDNQSRRSSSGETTPAALCHQNETTGSTDSKCKPPLRRSNRLASKRARIE